MLEQRKFISEKKVEQFIISSVRHGDHSNHSITDSLTNKQVKEWFLQNGYKWKNLKKKTRRWDNFIPFVENLLHETWEVSEGGHAQAHSSVSGELLAEVKGSGKFVTSDYQAKLRSALKLKKEAIENADLEVFYSCLSKAFSSVDSYFNIKASEYNFSEGKEILIDTKDKPASLDKKFKEWVPLLTKGQKLDLGRKPWQLFKKLQEIRNSESIHPKQKAQGYTYKQLADLLNDFRDGFAVMFLNLHVINNDHACNALIREAFSPDVFVKK